MAKVSVKLVVGILAGLGVLTGGRILASRALLPGQAISGMSAMIHHNMSGDDMSDLEHGSTSAGQTGQRATAQLSVKGSVSPAQSFPLTITIKDPQGKPVKDFQITQEKLMHLIVVSNDLGFYEHIHPTFTGNGRFKISTALPQAGPYTLFSDFKPVGMRHQITALPLSVAGSPTPASPQVSLARTNLLLAPKSRLGRKTGG